MNASRTHMAALTVIAAATLLVACEKKTTATDTPAGSSTTTTSTTTVAPSPAASNAMSATGNAVERAADKSADAIGDAAITGMVKSALIADPDVKALSIDVDTKNGVVMLNGTADSAAHSEKATTVARGVDGVKSVENHLAVKP
jgi:hyperosmotically inducible periplasmic protein